MTDAQRGSGLVLERLDLALHDRTDFESGRPALDAYLERQAGQDLRRKANSVHVLVRSDEPRRILGYFTLCAVGLDPRAVPDALKKRLPRYPQVSATLIGRLAVDARVQGQGYGRELLVGALRLAIQSTQVVGSTLVVVDAIDDSAARFYAKYGFVRLQDTQRLVMAMATAEAALRAPRARR